VEDGRTSRSEIPEPAVGGSVGDMGEKAAPCTGRKVRDRETTLDWPPPTVAPLNKKQ
jgi:hypothetical protein